MSGKREKGEGQWPATACSSSSLFLSMWTIARGCCIRIQRSNKLWISLVKRGHVERSRRRRRRENKLDSELSCQNSHWSMYWWTKDVVIVVLEPFSNGSSSRIEISLGKRWACPKACQQQRTENKHTDAYSWRSSRSGLFVRNQHRNFLLPRQTNDRRVVELVLLDIRNAIRRSMKKIVSLLHPRCSVNSNV